MEINKNQLGKRIKDIRVNVCGKTMEEFGKLVDSGKSNVSRWERGENVPNDLTLKKIAELGNVSVEELLYGDVKNYFYNIIKDNSKDFYEKLDGKSPLKLFNAFYEAIGDVAEAGTPYYPESDYVLEMFHTFIDNQKKSVDKLMLAYGLYQAQESLITLIEPLKDDSLKTYLNSSLKKINNAIAAFESYFNTDVEEEVTHLKNMLKDKE